MRSAPRSDRRGFTLAELAVTVMIVGILSGLALPNLRNALLKAEAARLVSEAHTVRLAAYDFLGDNGRFPVSSVGVPPAEMEPYLPENYSFMIERVRFSWISIALPNTNNQWGARNLGILLIDYHQRPELRAAMKANEGPDTYWTPTQLLYLMPG